MPLSEEQIAKLLGMVAASEADCIDCDKCFDHLAEFAEAELTHREIPDAMKHIQVHLEQCPCCHDEFTALMTALRTLEGEVTSG
ncbi:hypothetical protein KOR42_40190 [Thalassoglobus neptunius]|uniref:Uncharacterized protein n=1 Tax=Thalassoglobus neptunius TaxID=1938619 RepID=A0A5C5WBG8_9PLAN|nr:hypothetical protein [Thalassoglobus neptunius]TWT48228.1 hypothetical protein KOR42_40190 [Thalassoglobus neptunius]